MALDHNPSQTDLIDYLNETTPKRRKARAPTKGRDLIAPSAFIERLGPFDLDPCAAKVQPWECAKASYALPVNGLEQTWRGRVWLNPPNGVDTIKWVRKLADHGHGTALLMARTDSEMFAAYVFGRASALYFLEGRVRFFTPAGNPCKRPAGAASVLVAYGSYDAKQLETCALGGFYVPITPDALYGRKGSSKKR